MPYQKQTKTDNRRQWRKSGIDSKDGEQTYKLVSIKLKDKIFARPIILIGNLALKYFLDSWRKNGWKEGNEW
jgi:hypothetical protein